VRPEDRLLASWRLVAMSRQQVKSSQKLVKYALARADVVFRENLEHSMDNISRSTDILFEPWWTLPGAVGQERS
jgi:hypothetical protein